MSVPGTPDRAKIASFPAHAILAAVFLWVPLSPDIARADKSALSQAATREALAKEIHGRFKLHKELLQIQYDFRSEEQAQDFIIRERYGHRALASGPKHPSIQPGSIALPAAGDVLLQAPFEQITNAMVVVRGVDAFSLQFRGEGLDVIEVNFGDYPRIRVNGDLGDGQWKRSKIKPALEYRFELLIRGDQIVARINGSDVIKKTCAGELRGHGTLRFSRHGFVGVAGRSSGEGEAFVSKVVVRGILSKNAALVAANRGRAYDQQLPVWPRSYEAKGKYFDVVAASSQETASTWQTKLDLLVAAIINDYPADVQPLPIASPTPSPDGGAAGEPAEGVPDQPVDKRNRNKPWEFKKCRVFVFDHVAVHDAYRGEKVPRYADSTFPRPSLVGDTRLWTLVDPGARDDQISQQLARSLGAEVAHAVLSALYRSPPLWWMEGHCTYYSRSLLGADVVLGAVDPQLVRGARQWIQNQTEPTVSDLLADKVVELRQPRLRDLCWAWVHFLRHGDDRAHRELTSRIHRALRHGESPKAAVAAVLPVSTFNEIYPLFTEYLEQL
ncbi:MAG: hypothetical protein AAF581_02035 [Planctomycetota bacterium]